MFPRVIASGHCKPFDRGTNVLLLGATGVGKSSLALTYAIAAAARGEKAVVLRFERHDCACQHLWYATECGGRRRVRSDIPH